MGAGLRIQAGEDVQAIMREPVTCQPAGQYWKAELTVTREVPGTSLGG